MSDRRPKASADDALRLRRADRRAERRQVDAGQPAGRHQGVDRHAQGADDARHRARHRHAWQGADRLRRHARHLQAAPPARPGDGDDRLGRRQGRRHRAGADRCRARHRRAMPTAILDSLKPTCASRSPGSEQGRPREAGTAADADERGQRACRLRRAPSWFRR